MKKSRLQDDAKGMIVAKAAKKNVDDVDSVDNVDDDDISTAFGGSDHHEEVLDEKAQQQQMIKACIKNKTQWVAFSDGSSLNNPGPAGAAALIVLPVPMHRTTGNTVNDLGVDVHGNKTMMKSYVSSTTATNNQMEIKGVELALDLLEQQQEVSPRANWTIFTDSDYCVGLVERKNNAVANAVMVASLRNRVANYRKKVNVKLIWVRSHCGISYNEKVDQLSRLAAKQCKRNLLLLSGTKDLGNVVVVGGSKKRKAPKANNKPEPISLNHVREEQKKARATVGRLSSEAVPELKHMSGHQSNLYLNPVPTTITTTTTTSIGHRKPATPAIRKSNASVLAPTTLSLSSSSSSINAVPAPSGSFYLHRK
jgi:ribonuclease HI